MNEIDMAYQTKQKSAVHKILSNAIAPMTPQQIHDLAKASCPSIGLATIYRFLRVMLKEGEVRLVDIAGATPHYEIERHKHHHFFFCDKCKQVFDIEECVDGLSALVPEGFQMLNHEITIYGICKSCEQEPTEQVACCS